MSNKTKNKNDFTFCNYPFLLDIRFKEKLLECESKFE